MYLLLRLLINAGALWAATQFVSGISFSGDIPRFLVQGKAFQSELILLGLAGGRMFNTIVNFWIYNDNEEAFSAQYQFRCWDRVPLASINGSFTTTSTAPGTLLTSEFVAEPTGLLRFADGLFGSLIRRKFEGDLANLKRLMESNEL